MILGLLQYLECVASCVANSDPKDRQTDHPLSARR